MDLQSALSRAVRDAAESLVRQLASKSVESFAFAFLAVLALMSLVRLVAGRTAFAVLQSALLACLVAAQVAAVAVMATLVAGHEKQT